MEIISRRTTAGTLMDQYHFRHLYGPSYFGSGGCYGRVACDGNCRTFGSRDNGFVAGPEGVEVIDPTRPASFSASGGDCVGDAGREWSERGTWSVQEQAWSCGS